MPAPMESNISVNARDALDHIPSGVGIYDVTGNRIVMKYLNDGYYQMLGAERGARSEFFGDGVIDAIHPDDRPRLLAEAHDAIREKRMFDLRFRVMGGGGDYIWIGIRANHRALGAETERFFAAYYNVDRFVSEKNELAAYGNHLDEMLGNIPGGVAVFTERGGEFRLIYTNQGFYALHHGSREYWLEQCQDPVDWLVPEDRHLFLNEYRKVSSGEKAQGSATYRIVGEDGMFHWVCNQFCQAYQENGVRYYYASFTDLDDQIAAEQELLQDKLMYDDAARSAKLIIWSYDISTRRASMMQSGYTEEICRRLNIPPVIDNVMESLIDFVHPDDRDAFLEAYRSINEGAENAECEFRFQLPGQKTMQLEKMALRRMTDKDGRLLSVYCYGQNVTEQRQRESVYEQTFRQLDAAYQHPLGSFRLNLTKNWCGDGKSPLPFVLKQQRSGTVDGYFEEFGKLIADEPVKADFYRRFDRELLLKDFARGVTETSIEYPIVYADGTRHWRNGLLFMLKNPKTGDVEAVTYAMDIDARKKNEFIMAKLIHDHFDYIGIIHPSAKTFEFHSRRPWIDYGKIGEAFQYSDCCAYVRSQLVSESEISAFNDAVSLESIMRDMNDKGSRSATYLKTIGGKTECVSLQYSWLEKAGGDVLIVRSYVTEAYQKEQEQMRLLGEEKRAAEAASIAKSEFLSRMSHDMRTPLNGIIGMTYLTREMALPQKAMENLAKIDTSSKFLLSLINDVLDMSKAESGKIELCPEPYPVDEFADYINSIIAPLCEERSQKFTFEPVEILDGVVPLFDKLRINQVVFNLLSNAVKYTPEGGNILYRVVEKRLSGDRMSMHIDIVDNGVGMSEKFQKVLFDPFTQENRVDTAEMRGSGLGLAIAKRLIDAMGGTISVSSELGKGTAFAMDFLLDCVPSENKKDDRKSDADAAQRLAGRHILLCEDHPLNQEIAKTILEERHAIVTVAGDGDAGVKTFLSSSIGFFDAVLMDLRMPVMGGIDATKAIRALCRPDAKTVPIIAMTADAFAEDVQKCLDAGMNGHVAKPIAPDKLYAALALHLAEKKNPA
jgi:signal transduction histidine kinase/CheY-like chemotaxis protein/PAS domain-containing protein